MDALLVVDVQCGLFADPAVQPHDGEAVVVRIAGLIEKARLAGVKVVFIQHEGFAGDPLERGTPGFAYRPELAALPDDPVVVKRFCNGFQDTELDTVLTGLGVSNVAVCGMQTKYCVDTICRAAFERGYKVTLIGDAHTTFDNGVISGTQIVQHHNATLGSAFATVQQSASVSF